VDVCNPYSSELPSVHCTLWMEQRLRDSHPFFHSFIFLARCQQKCYVAGESVAISLSCPTCQYERGRNVELSNNNSLQSYSLCTLQGQGHAMSGSLVPFVLPTWKTRRLYRGSFFIHAMRKGSSGLHAIHHP
jgi:hypothetical protein